MRAIVLSRRSSAWGVGLRSATELKEAAAHFDRAAALCDAPAVKAEYWRLATSRVAARHEPRSGPPRATRLVAGRYAAPRRGHVVVWGPRRGFENGHR
eukprot:scaffold11279_cov65-Phaeocystis_antarctica.AAC.4